MLGADWLSPYGPDTRYAFGHLGFTNVVAWADPEEEPTRLEAFLDQHHLTPAPADQSRNFGSEWKVG